VAAKSKDAEDVISEINVTPFVDIVLVLLIILMVTSTQIIKSSLRVELPTAASGGETVESTLNIVLTKDGEMFLDGNPSTESELVEQVQKEKRKNEKLQAVIAADKGVVYGKVVHVIDVVKTNGVKSFALNIERENPAGASKAD
jgi:biopolymer transport protein TolR